MLKFYRLLLSISRANVWGQITENSFKLENLSSMTTDDLNADLDLKVKTYFRNVFWQALQRLFPFLSDTSGAEREGAVG